VELSVCISITITDRERIFPWRKIRRSRGQSSRRNSGLWFPCRKSAGSTTVTNDAPPEILTSKSLRPRRTTARRWAFYGDLHSQLTKIASGALARILLAPPKTRSYSRISNIDGVCGRHTSVRKRIGATSGPEILSGGEHGTRHGPAISGALDGGAAETGTATNGSR
jgi:hypothetical protein